jgi:hypothetical protein
MHSAWDSGDRSHRVSAIIDYYLIVYKFMLLSLYVRYLHKEDISLDLITILTVNN